MSSAQSDIETLLENRPIRDAPVVVLDTETTGLEAGLGHRVVEIGAIRFENGKRTDEIEYLIDPQRPMTERASEVTGIVDDDLKGKPIFAEIIPELNRILDGAIIVAHNAAFDADFLGFEYSFAHPDAEPNRLILPNPWLCTLILAKSYFHFGKNSLANIARSLQIPQTKAHRALNDVVTTAEVFFRLTKQLEKQHKYRTVGDLLHAQGHTIYATPPMEIDLPPLLAQAVEKQIDLQLIYVSPKKGMTERRVSPHYAALHKGAPYIVGYCHLREELRSFRVDRIMGAELISD